MKVSTPVSMHSMQLMSSTAISLVAGSDHIISNLGVSGRSPLGNPDDVLHARSGTSFDGSRDGFHPPTASIDDQYRKMITDMGKLPNNDEGAPPVGDTVISSWRRHVHDGRITGLVPVGHKHDDGSGEIPPTFMLDDHIESGGHRAAA